jgi:hypothetical protein
MARKRSAFPATTSSVEPPNVYVTCEHCQKTGKAGAEISPYAFAKDAPRVWLHRQPCMPLAYAEWKAKQ